MFASPDQRTMTDADRVVDVRDLHKTYAGGLLRRRQRVQALRGVSLQADAGEVFGLLGPNGAGKTTLIKTLLGIIKPSSGEASLFGIPVRSHAARRRVGYLPESLRIDRHHTATTALQYYGKLSGMDSAAIARRRDELLTLVGLEKRANESVKRFSKGMYQRLGLAQALLHDPHLLILDEPTDGLDPVGRSEVRRVIERLRDEGKTIFLNSHILQEVELICTRVAIMSQGVIRGIGSIDQLRGDQAHSGVRLNLSVLLDRYRQPESGDASSPAEHLRRTLIDAGFKVDSVRPQDGAEHRFQITGQTDGRDGTDALIDWLRDHDISVLELSAHRPTLEDTFLRLVGPTPVTQAATHDAAGPENFDRTSSTDRRSPS